MESMKYAVIIIVKKGDSIDVTCIFVVEDGVGHFEEDKMN